MSNDYFTKESEGKIGTVSTVEDALRAHHLATADPETDGLLTGAEHEAKYGLERADVEAVDEPVEVSTDDVTEPDVPEGSGTEGQ